MKTYNVIIGGKNIEVVQNEDGTFNKPEIVEELLKFGTAMKPAHEPICLARKPLSEKTVAKNVLKYGTGGINIDESRVGIEYELTEDIINNIIKICQLNHLLLPVNNVEKKKFQQDTTNLIKKMYSVVENVDMIILEKILGKLLENTTNLDTQCSEEMLEENMNISLNTFTFGKEKMEKYQMVLRYITSMVLKMITDWKISNALIYQVIEVLLIKERKEIITSEKLGRFPANLCHDNSEEVKECFPDTKSGNLNPGHKRGDGTGNSLMGGGGVITGTYGGDSGSAARFFKSILYYPKASKSERNKGMDELEAKPMYKADGSSESLEIFGTTDGGREYRKNFHPTVKPTALMSYLIKMITPKGGIVLEPFAGSGSTLVAARDNGFQYVGIEMTEEYLPIIEARTGCEIVRSNGVIAPETTEETVEAKEVKPINKKHICPVCQIYTDDNGVCKFCNN